MLKAVEEIDPKYLVKVKQLEQRRLGHFTWFGEVVTKLRLPS
jgi:hypothetical protein